MPIPPAGAVAILGPELVLGASPAVRMLASLAEAGVALELELALGGPLAGAEAVLGFELVLGTPRAVRVLALLAAAGVVLGLVLALGEPRPSE